MPEKPTEYAKGYTAAMEETYDWMYETTQEWYDLKIVNAEQMLALKDLVHEMWKRL